jgi:cell division transport system ATP-binding protein
MERVTRGSILLNGHPVHALPTGKIPYVRRSIGFILQQPRLLMDRTLFDNVALPLVISGYERSETIRRVRTALDKVGLLQKEKLYPQALSSGEQQRASIARAIVNKPPLLLADEPTGNLDPTLSTEIMRLLLQFNQVGVAILVASHDFSLIKSMRRRVITLKQGMVVQDDFK